MSAGETAKHVSGWTVDTVKEMFDVQLGDLRRMLDERMVAQQTAMHAALAATEKAVSTALEAVEKSNAKAELATDKRFESVNEFRAQLADQARTFMPRTESISRHDRAAEQMLTLMAKIDDEAKRGHENRAALESRLTARLDAQQSRLDLSQGRSKGLGDGWGYLVGAIGLLGGVIALVVGLR